MMKIIIRFGIFGLISVVATTFVDRHSALKGHQIWSVKLDKNDLEGPDLLLSLLQEGKIDILGNDKRSSRFRVLPEDKEYVMKQLLGKNYKPKVDVEELATYLQDLEDTDLNEIELTRQGTTCTSTSCPLPLAGRYMTFDQIRWYINSTMHQHPDIVTVNSLGITAQKRNIWMIKIATPSSNSTRSVWVEGGIHAREWISPAVTLQLVQNLINEQISTGSLNGTDYYIVPVANPDGYVYTFTTNRLWRKNRTPTSNIYCPGVDLNRNWDFQWGVGASTNPCSEVYRGPTPFSTAETIAMSSAMKIIPNLKLVFAIHSYSQLLLYPWGYTLAAAPDTTAMITLGKAFSTAAYSVNNVPYTVANIAGGLYFASGTTTDWAKGILKTKYSLAVELRDKGTYGFLLPASQIEQTRKEIWAGFIAMINLLDQ